MPESWWKDLPDNCLAVMGYNGQDEESEESPEDHTTLQQDIKNLRRKRQGL